MLNLSSLLENNARLFPSKTAFILGDHQFTYQQIDALANKVANGLKEMGIKPGDKIALTCPNLPQFPIIYFGILKTGAVVVPLSVLLKKDEIAYHLNDSDAKTYFCFTGSDELPMGKMGFAGFNEAPKCDHFFMIMPTLSMASSIDGTETLATLINDQPPHFETHQTSAEDTALIVYTSGTTGVPKGAELTHSNLLLNAMVASNLIQCTPKDRSLLALPLFHIFGMSAVMNALLYRGGSFVLLPKFDAQTALKLIEEYDITLFAGVPTMYWSINHYEGDDIDYNKITNNLRITMSGGASLPKQVLKEFEKRFDVQILEGYGMSEGSPVVTFNHPDVGKKIGSIGTPVWGVEVKIVDESGIELPAGEKGELIYRGHNVMKGYYKRPEDTSETIKNGWLYSGDVAIMDEDGFFFIVDRTKDMIIRGGFNVYPREVEEVMITHKAVSLVAVIGVPNEKLGEEIKAFVVLKEGKSVSEEELILWTKQHIADYKYPRIIKFTNQLPLSATGKILKKELR